MNRKTIPLLAAVTFAAAPLARGQAYVGTVLYPLTPPAGLSLGYTNIECDDTGQVVATIGFNYYAVFWPGTSSGVELNPGSSLAQAEAVQGNEQVGEYSSKAYLWKGSAASGVNLNPSGFYGSCALGTDGSQQVGYASPSNFDPSLHWAFLWNGTAASAVDLNPSGISASEALGTDGAQQVGYAHTGEYLNALLWSGTANSYV
ncbi:MAG: hypothetical protein ABSH08_21530, partial [Tepidisphaeraceae bacterium]